MEALFTDEKNELLGYQKVDTLNRKSKILKNLLFPDGGENTDWKELWNGTVREIFLFKCKALYLFFLYSM
jgi:hypothetical protein